MEQKNTDNELKKSRSKTSFKGHGEDSKGEKRDKVEIMAEDDSSSYPLWSMVSVVIVRASQLLLGLTTVTLLGLYYKQDSLLYFPSIGNMPKKPAHNPRGHRSPAEYQMAFEDIQIVCEDKVKIHAWLIFGEEKTGDSSASTPTLVFFHGNAGNIGFRLPNAVQMVRRLGVNVCLVEYRGYGNSDAVAPNEKGLKRDGVAALKFLQDHPKVNADNIFLFGRSLGGAVSLCVCGVSYCLTHCYRALSLSFFFLLILI